MNIYDIAKLAGVSIATASKALNNRQDVRPETREKVFALAKKYSYQPSRGGRASARRRTGTLGVVAPRRLQDSILTNPFYGPVLEGMEREAARRDHNLLLCLVPEGLPAFETAFTGIIPLKKLDAICLLGELSEGFMREALARAVPCVAVDMFFPALPGHYVMADNVGGVRLLVDHMIKLGHKRIAWMGDTEEPRAFSFTEREEAFQAGMRRAGLQHVPGVAPNISASSARAKVREYLKSQDMPLALICCNDAHALLALEVARDLGLKIPQELSVAGFDDIAFAGFSQPGLTTVHVEKQEMGAKAVHVALDLVERPGAAPKRLETPVYLVKRASTGAPGL